MKAAIYARKSTDDNDRDAENKSVTRQVEHARKFIAAKGWTVGDEHIYVDDGISGAEFRKRPGLLRMLNHLKDFDIVVASELSRIGREQTQTAHVLAEIYGRGKRVFFYLTDEELKFKSAVEKFMVGAVSFGAELEREKASQRSLDALTRKAAKGFNAGGACFGYDNMPVYSTATNGEQVKSHTDYQINENQAETIRGIFSAYADGHSHTSIAKAMNGNSAEGKRLRTLRRDLDAIRKRYFGGRMPPSPQRGKRGTGSWAPAAIREILYRHRYVGKVPFNGSVADRPDLRIVDEKLWQRVQARLKGVRETYIRDAGKLWGRPSAEKYLLSGMGKCTCGKAITIVDGYNGSAGRRQRAYWYGCSYHHARGRTICANNHRARMEDLDQAVIKAIESQVLTPHAIAFTIEEAAKTAERELREHPDKPRKLEAEARKVKKELDRFLQLVADGKAPDSVLAEIKQREERLRELEREQQTLQQALPVLDPAQIRAMCGERLNRFAALLHKDTPVSRQALRKLLPEPLRIFPATVDGRRTLRFEGMTVLGPLLEDVRIGMASPRGFEPRLPP